MKKLTLLIFGGITLLLLASVLWSGYNYVFDNDELSHVHMVYLIAKGYQPYTSFFSIYSPVLHWLLIPLFQLNGFSLGTIADARVVMIILFLLRMGAAGLFVKELFGKRTALLFLPIFLMDPFTVFTAMQIRPDNLMMTLYTLGLLTLILGVKHKNQRFVMIAGMLLGLTVVAMIKIAPSFAVFFILLILFHRTKDIRKIILPLATGFAVSVGIFALYFFVNGSFGFMIQQVVLDGKLLNDSLLYPVTPGSFYWPVNVYLYGHTGRSIVWIYAWIFLVAGFSGALQIFLRFSTEAISMKTTIKLYLVITLLIHWFLLFLFRSVFLQYYLTISWLLAIGAAVLVHELLSIPYQSRAFRIAVMASLIGTFIFVGKASIELNIARATIDGHEQKARLEAILTKIPLQEPVFPGFLFRPLVYPLPYGYYYGDMPHEVIKRFPSIVEVLDKMNVRFVIATESYLSYAPKEVEQYVKERFVRDGQELWIRKNE